MDGPRPAQGLGWTGMLPDGPASHTAAAFLDGWFRTATIFCGHGDTTMSNESYRSCFDKAAGPEVAFSPGHKEDFFLTTRPVGTQYCKALMTQGQPGELGRTTALWGHCL